MNRRKFQRLIKYKFNDESLLEEALTHSSYAKDNNLPRRSCNERLEYLGDGFFDAIVGEILFKRLRDDEEGRLSKIRASVVCEKSLFAQGTRLHVGELLRLGHGEEHSGGRARESVVADAMEALIGAIFLDGGYECTKDFVLRIFGDAIDAAIGGKLYSDYKSAIQEEAQAAGLSDITYILDHEDGPAHDKTFFMKLEINGKAAGTGIGKTKKEAEQAAAKMAYERGISNVL